MISNKRELYKGFALFVIAAVAATMLFASPAWAQDLEVTKNAPSTVVEDEEFTYTIEISNDTGVDDLTVIFQDDLPSTTTFSGIDFPAGATCTVPAQGTPSTANPDVECTIPDFDDGESTTITIQVVPTAAGQIVNEARVMGGGFMDDDSVSTTVTANSGGGGGDSGLTITKEAPSTVDVNEDFTFTIEVTNESNQTARNVVIEDTLDSDLTFVDFGGPDGDTCDRSGRDITCEIGDLGVDETAEVRIIVEADNEGRIENTAELSSDNFTDTDDSVEVTVRNEDNNNGNNDNDNDGINDNNDNDDDNDGIADSADTVNNIDDSTSTTEDQDGTTSDMEQTVSNSSADDQYDDGENTTGDGASASSGEDGSSAQAGGASAQADPDEQAPLDQQQVEEQGGDVVDEIPTEGPLPETGGASVATGTTLALVLFGVLLLALRLVSGWRGRRM